MNGTLESKKQRHWWRKDRQMLKEHEKTLDDEILDLLEDVESDFKESFAQHTKRLEELKEALRARKEREA